MSAAAFTQPNANRDTGLMGGAVTRAAKPLELLYESVRDSKVLSQRTRTHALSVIKPYLKSELDFDTAALTATALAAWTQVIHHQERLLSGDAKGKRANEDGIQWRAWRDAFAKALKDSGIKRPRTRNHQAKSGKRWTPAPSQPAPTPEREHRAAEPVASTAALDAESDKAAYVNLLSDTEDET